MSSSGWIRQHGVWVAVGAVWLGVVVHGLALVAGYDNRPGTPAAARVVWPAESRIARDQSRPTLVMMAHPRCDCTRASIAELAEVMARAESRPRAYVVFVKPHGMDDQWDRTGLRRAAARIPDVTVLRDDDGREAELFGAETSGQTFLYGVDGALLFSGGTTGARGHEGDNAGRAALLALINHETPRQHASLVFGCSLFALDPDQRLADTAHGPHRH
jgi:hypothetical protein